MSSLASTPLSSEQKSCLPSTRSYSALSPRHQERQDSFRSQGKPQRAELFPRQSSACVSSKCTRGWESLGHWSEERGGGGGGTTGSAFQSVFIQSEGDWRSPPPPGNGDNGRASRSAVWAAVHRTCCFAMGKDMLVLKALHGMAGVSPGDSQGAARFFSLLGNAHIIANPAAKSSARIPADRLPASPQTGSLTQVRPRPSLLEDQPVSSAQPVLGFH